MLNDLRGFLSLLESKGELVHIKREVDPNGFEIAAVIRKVEEETSKGVIFDKVKGYGDLKVCANLYGTLTRLALALGIDPSEEEVGRLRAESRGSAGGVAGCTRKSFLMTERDRACAIKLQDALPVAEARAKDFPIKVVRSSPVKEVVLKDDIDIAKTIPIIWHCMEDAGPFITAGVCVSKDRGTQDHDSGIFRSQVTKDPYGPKRFGMLLSVPSMTGRRLAQYERANEPMPTAIVLSPEPAVHVTSVYGSSPGVNKYEFAGALKGSPIEMVKCETIDLLVPANSEVVIEGHILPGLRVPEGPMAEFTDCYREDRAPKPVFEATAITHRKGAIHHTIMSGMSDEHRTLVSMVGWGYQRELMKRIKMEFPTVKALTYALGSNEFHLVVSMKKEREGEDKRLLYYIMGLSLGTYFKFVTIVDDDIDIYNPDHVEWARCARGGFKGSYFIFEDSYTHNLDPMGRMTGPAEHQRLSVDKLGILATRRVDETYRRPGPPDEILNKTNIKDYV